MIDLHMSG